MKTKITAGIYQYTDGNVYDVYRNPDPILGWLAQRCWDVSKTTGPNGVILRGIYDNTKPKVVTVEFWIDLDMVVFPPSLIAKSLDFSVKA